ncbi:hypothetical protein BPAE_0047g00100 [Botrytis paeoniae]|uniref:Uncharacterized protein n=1 Tax=Botrytis paeoniae TaxID=278948 RepID=A0A4Z1FQP3_9HELO|nr:hypothetical protein BPAE_0047g00100 [Botrytis paeoniae]
MALMWHGSETIKLPTTSEPPGFQISDGQARFNRSVLWAKANARSSWSLEKLVNMHQSQNFCWSTLLFKPLFAVSNDLTDFQPFGKIYLRSKKGWRSCILAVVRTRLLLRKSSSADPLRIFHHALQDNENQPYMQKPSKY